MIYCTTVTKAEYFETIVEENSYNSYRHVWSGLLNVEIS